MRLTAVILAAITVLLPIMAQAQFSFAPGSYQLANGAKGTASLKLVLAENSNPTVLAGTKNGRERKFRSAELTSFTIENHRFIRVNDFRFRSGADANFREPTFLEIAETGPVELFYYYYLVEMGPNFKAHVKLPVLRKAGANLFFAYNPSHTPGFDQKLAPSAFVATLFPADLVLQRQLAANGISRQQIAAVVQAYNKGVRLTP